MAAAAPPPPLPPPGGSKPPGSKRLLVICSVLAYVLFLGLPVWWATTTLHRPPLPHDAMQQAARGADDSPAFLPVALQVVLVLQPAGADQHQQQSAAAAAALHASLSAALSDSLPERSGAPMQLSVVVASPDAAHCSRFPPAAGAPAAAACPDFTGAPPGSEHGGGSGGGLLLQQQQQQQQLDDWLHALLQQQQQALLAASRPGQYSLFLLPQQLLGAEQPLLRLVAGRHRHAWLPYSADVTQEQLHAAAAAAAAAALSCCFARHAGRPGLASAAALPVSAGGRTHLSLSLLNAAPLAGGGHYAWDMQHWEEAYLAPIRATLAPVAALSLESQVLHHTPARSPGRWSAGRGAYVVDAAQLPFFIDSEWALEAGRAVSPQAALGAAGAAAAGQALLPPAGPGGGGSCAASAAAALLDSPHVLQFVAYVPPRHHRPLQLLDAQGQPPDSNSYLIPSWGGLMVLNPDDALQQELQEAGGGACGGSGGGSGGGGSQGEGGACEPWAPLLLTAQQYAHITAVVVAQLQALFGVAPAGEAGQQQGGGRGTAMRVQHLPAGPLGFCGWQVDALMRQRSAHGVGEAGRVLAALSTLVQELPNLEMPDLIGQQVAEALAGIAQARARIAAGDYAAAAAAAAAAHAAAEAAFSHPAVLTQLNFPESHKLGVYMPLFLPLAVPLLQGILVQLAHRRQRRAQRGGGGGPSAS